MTCFDICIGYDNDKKQKKTKKVYVTNFRIRLMPNYVGDW